MIAIRKRKLVKRKDGRKTNWLSLTRSNGFVALIDHIRPTDPLLPVDIVVDDDIGDPPTGSRSSGGSGTTRIGRLDRLG